MKKPVWGTLTGIRPSKLIEKELEAGISNVVAADNFMRKYYVTPQRAKLCSTIAIKSLQLKRSLKPNDISLYVGIPFCPSRCAYCSFVSNSVEKSFDLIRPFVNLLLSEIYEIAKVTKELELNVISVYIGGGTPTVLSVENLDKILQALSQHFDLSSNREYTVEAGRPDTITTEKLEILKKHNVTRICVNPQSMSKVVLEAIGRKHSPDDIVKSVELVRSCKFLLNMDIIAGLPADTPEGFSKTLDTILSFDPENITVHTLSLKKGSQIMVEGTKLPDEKSVKDMLDYGAENLPKHNYVPYYLYRLKYTSGGFENIGWSKPGFEGIYNKLMMEDQHTVFGMGAGAATKLVLPAGRIERIFNSKYPREYILQSDKIIDKIDKIKSYYK